jgi:exopolyphosphatase/pppGpp-phosphohydrolase
MNKRIAILDLGTNISLTYCGSETGSTFEVLFKAEEFVKLGEEGVERIGDRAFERGLSKLENIKQSLMI